MRTILVTSAAAAATAVVGSLGTDPQSTWYQRLRKPPWNPPAVVFPLVWTPLYGLIAFGSARLIDASADEADRRRMAALLGTDLILNAGWCWAFFAGKSLRGGLATIVVLDGLNIALVGAARRRDPIAAAALTPYALWTLFATGLNMSLLARNT